MCISVCLFVTLLFQIDSSFLFLDGIEPFFGRQFSIWRSTKFFSIFDLGPLTPKIHSPKFCRPLFTGAAPGQTGVSNRYTHVCDGSNGQSVHKDMHVGPIFVAMATTFALGVESNRLPACLYNVFVLSVRSVMTLAGRASRLEVTTAAVNMGDAAATPCNEP